MIPPISIMLIDSDSKGRNAIIALLKSVNGNLDILASSSDLQEGMKAIHNADPQIVLLEVKEIEQGVRETAFLAARFPHASVFVTATEKNPDWILRLIRAGADEYLTRPVIAQELSEAVQKVMRQHAQKSMQKRVKGSVITLYNPSAGMGTTTIAVNLAAMLAAQGKEVALVDLNLCSADVAAFLDITPRYTLSSITAKKGHIDASLLKSIIVPHASGVHVLNGPRDLVEADRLPPDLLQEVIGVLQTCFDHVVIDSGAQLFGCNLATFACSDQILFATVLNLPALNNAKRYFMTMGREGFDSDRLRLLVNRYNPRDDIKLKDAEKILNTRTYLAIPNSYVEVSTSINKGAPLVTCYPRSAVTKAIGDLAGQLTQNGTSRGKPA